MYHTLKNVTKSKLSPLYKTQFINTQHNWLSSVNLNCFNTLTSKTHTYQLIKISINYIKSEEPLQSQVTCSNSSKTDENQLIIAISEKNIERIAFLITKKINFLFQTKNGKTILEEVFEINSDLIITMLSSNDNAKIALYHAASNGNINLFKFIVNTKLVDLEEQDKNGFTLVQNILHKGNNNLIRTIIAYIMQSSEENEDPHGDHDHDILERNKNFNSPYIKSKTTNCFGLRELQNPRQNLASRS